jgi:hypothetical protein
MRRTRGKLKEVIVEESTAPVNRHGTAAEMLLDSAPESGIISAEETAPLSSHQEVCAMSHRRCKFALSAILPVFLALLFVLFSACSEKTTAPAQDPQGSLSGSGNIDPSSTASFLLGSVSDSTVAPGCVEVWGSNVQFDADSGYVTFDVQLVNRSRRNIFPSIRFVITDIIPDDISLVGFDGVAPDGKPFFDFSGKLGPDGVLVPGETSEPVGLKFHTVTARSFAIGFRIDLAGPTGSAVISGVVYQDDNQNGSRDRCDRCEPGIPGITVALERSLSGGGIVTFITKTDADGAYRFGGLREGTCTVRVVAPSGKWKVTSTNPLLITLVKDENGQVQDFDGADFGLFPLTPPRPEILFGPILVGPFGPYGTTVDSTFVNPPSPLTVVFHYYLDVTEPPSMSAIRAGVDSASAWINDVLVYSYHRPAPPDTVVYFRGGKVALPDSLVKAGENKIRIFTSGGEHAGLMWTVYRKP